MSTTVPQPILSLTGYLIPEEADILTALLNDINTAFGGGMNLDLATPQGQLASSIAAIIADKNDLFLSYTSQMDPQYARGRMQDALGEIYFMHRIPSSPTSVICTCTGLEGTVIPNYALAKDEDGNIYSCSAGGAISSGGTTTLTFNNIVNGPIPCSARTLTTIYGAIPGWDTITNETNGVLGAYAETQSAFELRRRQSVSINALGLLQSIYAEVAASGVALVPPNIPTDVLVRENPTSANKTIKGVVLAPHSVYVAVVGGDSTEIGKAILSRVSAGCDFNGNTTVSVPDDTNYMAPYPTYDVKYQVPVSLPILFKVTLATNPSYPSDLANLVKTAIIDAFDGKDGGSKVRIGTDVYASRYYTPVENCCAGIEIVSILIGTVSATANSVTVNLDKFPTIAASQISVAVV